MIMTLIMISIMMKMNILHAERLFLIDRQAKDSQAKQRTVVRQSKGQSGKQRTVVRQAKALQRPCKGLAKALRRLAKALQRLCKALQRFFSIFVTFNVKLKMYMFMFGN